MCPGGACACVGRVSVNVWVASFPGHYEPGNEASVWVDWIMKTCPRYMYYMHEVYTATNGPCRGTDYING